MKLYSLSFIAFVCLLLLPCLSAALIQPDPIIQDIYNPQDLNRYSYVRNNPYKYTDPTGNVPVLVVTAGIGAGIGAVSSITYQLATTGEVNARQVAISTGAGAVAGLTGFGAAALISSSVGSAAESVAVSVGSAAVVNAVAGEAGAYAESRLSGQDYSVDPTRVGVNAFVGGVTGGIANKLFGQSTRTTNVVQSQSNVLSTTQGEFTITSHALDRAGSNKISTSNILSTIEKNDPFDYNYGGEKFTGYYDPKSKVFVPVSSKGRITTVGYRNQGYIDRLKRASTRR